MFSLKNIFITCTVLAAALVFSGCGGCGVSCGDASKSEIDHQGERESSLDDVRSGRMLDTMDLINELTSARRSHATDSSTNLDASTRPLPPDQSGRIHTTQPVMTTTSTTTPSTPYGWADKVS
ncbi:hypothetical protein Pmar_PMAR008645 [Perkinsus marinus ATCC 50983]|uniref:Uncharacterized protein n=1 Tax=Perkinsus marinus (strain ATCC 50983 / TXsc) TaxID=423536 RepID=C5LQ87_PERM5|nr:hypothetical protein Pmar_PMAR008645 [Perkinsus marinus ATCC 50983]EER01096.1 hypothetical protein Pmar_PMAR008645 [Perkinsus marinus ATCC 50983]|eukprot:XP_002768378.1 hypothetical protein Pmar_PMAR008645 [Perkinsus marinus ATCC 50983]